MPGASADILAEVIKKNYRLRRLEFDMESILISILISISTWILILISVPRLNSMAGSLVEFVVSAAS